MTVVRWMYLALGLTALTFLASSLAALYGASTSLSLGTLLLAAGYAALVMVLLRLSRGLPRTVFVAVTFVVIIAYAGRLLALTFAPHHFAYDHLIAFSDVTVRRSLWLLSAVTFSF